VALILVTAFALLPMAVVLDYPVLVSTSMVRMLLLGIFVHCRRHPVHAHASIAPILHDCNPQLLLTCLAKHLLHQPEYILYWEDDLLGGNAHTLVIGSHLSTRI